MPMAPETHTARSASRGDANTSFHKGSSSLLRSTGRLKRLILLFFFFGLIAIAVNVKFLLDVNSEMGQLTRLESGRQAIGSVASTANSEAMLRTTRNRIAVLLGITVICFGSVLYLFVKRVVSPLNTLTRALQEMTTGNLSVTVPTNPHTDIGELGEAVNDLAANFQEVLLLTGTIAGNSVSAVEQIEKAWECQGTTSGDELCAQIRLVRQDLETIASMVKEFEFYQARFNGRDVAENVSGRKKPDAGRLSDRVRSRTTINEQPPEACDNRPKGKCDD